MFTPNYQKQYDRVLFSLSQSREMLDALLQHHQALEHEELDGINNQERLCSALAAIDAHLDTAQRSADVFSYLVSLSNKEA